MNKIRRKEIDETLTKIIDLKVYLQKHYKQIQAFASRNICGDCMETVYSKNGIVVDYAINYEYIEIFGLTAKEFEDLLDKNSLFGSNIRDFENDLALSK